MAFVVPSRVLETGSGSGTGNVTLLGASGSGEYDAYNERLSVTDTTIYVIVDGAQFEIGYGTYSSATPNNGTLTRDTVIRSSSGTTKISLSGSNFNIFGDVPTEKMLVVGPDGAVTNVSAVAASVIPKNFTALKALPVPSDDTIVGVGFGATEGDGLGGLFRWDANSTATADDVHILQADAVGASAGRWIRERHSLFLAERGSDPANDDEIVRRSDTHDIKSKRTDTGVKIIPEVQNVARVGSYATLAALKAVASANWKQGDLIELRGITAEGDTSIKVGTWQASSTNTDALDKTFVRPDDISGANPGRFQFPSDINLGDTLIIENLTALQALTLASVNNGDVLYLKGRASVGDGGEGHFRVTTSDISAEVAIDTAGGVWVPFSGGDGSTGGFVRMDVKEKFSALWFGAVGDETLAVVGGTAPSGTNDSAAIQNLFNVVQAVSGRVAWLPGNGRCYRLSSGVTLDGGNRENIGLIIDGPIRPDNGVGAAVTIENIEEFHGRLEVSGGGEAVSTANGISTDYTQAEPTGFQEAFRIQNVRGAIISSVSALRYKGRVLALRAGAGTLKTSRLSIEAFHTGDFGAAACGQSIYADAGNALISISVANWFWDEYGPVFKDCADIHIGQIDSGFKYNNGMVFQGCLSIWGSSWNVGDEDNGITALTIEPSTTGLSRPSGNINIEHFFTLGALRAAYLKDIGDDTVNVTGAIGLIHVDQCTDGVVIESCQGIACDVQSNNSGTALKLDGSRDFRGALYSVGDDIPLHVTGASQACEITVNILNADEEAVLIDGTANRIVVNGSIQNAGTDPTATHACVKVDSTQRSIIFNNLFVEDSGGATAAYDLAVGNQVEIVGGGVAGGISTVFLGGDLPNYVEKLRGFKTSASGIATIPNGTNNVLVTHGLAGTPQLVLLTAINNAEARQPLVYGVGATTFNIGVPSAVTADRSVYWQAKLLHERSV